MNPLAPTPKVATASVAGAISVVFVWLLNKYAHADINNEISQSITIIFSFIAAYFAPHSEPTRQQVEEIKQDVLDIQSKSK